MAGKTACVLLANGAEEMEAVIVIDVLRRAGVQVTVAGVDGPQITCSRGVVIVADKVFKDVLSQKFDLVVMPGGLKGSETLSSTPEVGTMLKTHEIDGRMVAAICAAPMALAAHGVGRGKNVTIYPSMEAKMSGYTCKDDRVVVDGKFVTSRGPGTAIDFALTLVKELAGEQAASATAKPMLVTF